MPQRADPAGPREKKLLMTHLVAGYPNYHDSIRLAVTLCQGGADLLEVQFPFSDPLADGPVIMNACGRAISGGATTAGSFSLVSRLSKETDASLVIMSYCNILLRFGIGSFVAEAREAGAGWLIVPDLPLDSPEGRELREECRSTGMNLVPVVSPGMSRSRLLKILSMGRGFIYATLKAGITGSPSRDPRTGEFLKDVRGNTRLPVLAGFGISCPREAGILAGNCDGVVIGSHLIRLLESHGMKGVSEFTERVSAALNGGRP